MDWNDPDELRRLHDLLDDEPTAGHDHRGPERPRHRHRRDARRTARHARHRRLVLHVQQREQRPDLGLPRRVPPARLALQGPRHDAVVRPMRDRALADGDQRGLPGPRGPGPDRPLPAHDRPGEVAAGLDDDPVDADLERGGGRRGRPALRARPPGRRPASGWPRGRSRPRSRARSRWRTRCPAPTSSAGSTPARSTSCRRCAPPSPRHAGRPVDAVPPSRGRPGTRSARTRAPGIVHIAPGCGAEDFQLGKSLGLPVVAPIDELGIVVEGFGSLIGPRRPRRRRADRRASQARGPVLPPRAVPAPLPALLALRDAAPLPPRRRVVHQHGSGLRPAARDAHRRAGRREPALPDHGRGRHHRVDPRVRAGARARLAAQHARLDDQQEALLGPGAADLRLRGVRDHRGHRRPRGAARAGGRAAGRASRATRRIARGSTT